MRQLKKYVLYFLCVCLMLGSFVPTSSAQNHYNYKEVAETLFNLSVLSEVREDMQVSVTRAELAGMASALVGQAKPSLPEGLFSDVAADNPYGSEIALLADLKVMNGYSDGTFRPDASVKVSEALKIFATILGYGPVAEHWGGYPNAYYRAANKSDLLRSIDSTGDQELTYGEAVQLLYNTITADMLQIVGIAGDAVEINVREGVSILTEIYDIHQYSGIVQATDVTSLTGGISLPKQTVRVGNADFKTAEGDDFGSYLGYFVDCYYKAEDSRREVVLMKKDFKENNELLVMAKDIVAVPTDSGSYFEYETTGKIQKQKIDAEADFIYNGKAYPGFSYSDMDIAAGYLTLVDNDTDGDADVILATEFETLVVKGVSESEGIVYGYYGANLVLGDNEENIKLVDAAGTEVKIGSINKENVLSVAKSKDGEIVLGILEIASMFGTITEVETEDGKIVSCVIDDNIYELTPELQNEILTVPSQACNFVAGTGARYGLTYDGKIAYSFSGIGGGMQYGYLLSTDTSKHPLRDTEAYFRIFTQDSEVKEFKGAENITVNSGKVSATAAVAQPAITDNSGMTIQQLVKYELNSDGELKTLYYATQPTDNFENELFYSDDASDTSYRSAEKSLEDFVVASDTLVFFISDLNSDGRISEDEIAINSSLLKNNATYQATAYDYGYYRVPKALTAQPLSKTGYDEYPFVFQKRTTVIDADAEERIKLVGFYKGKAAEHILSPNCTFNGISGISDLEEGDTVFINVNHNGEVSFVRKGFDISEDKVTDRVTMLKGTQFIGGALSITAGNVADFNATSIGVRSVNGLSAHPIVSSSSFYLYDSEAPAGKRVRVVNYEELAPETDAGPGSRVVLLNRYTSTYAIMIIR